MRPVPLVRFPEVSYTDAGCALGHDFDHIIRPLVSALIDAGFDTYHAERIMHREITWVFTTERIDRLPRI